MEFSPVSAWIWLDPGHFPEFQNAPVSAFDPAPAAPAMAVFTREFELGSTADLVACFSGDTKFRLWINDEFFADGPVEVGGDYAHLRPPSWWFHEERAAGDRLRRGRNTIRAEVMNLPEAQTDYSTGGNGFRFELRRGDEVLLGSDETWTAAVNRAWSPERYDARREVSLSETFPAFRSARAGRPTRSLDLPPLAERRIETSTPLPATVEPGPPRLIELDFPCEVAAHLELEVEGRAGAVIEMRYQELPGVVHDRRTLVLGDGRRRFRATRLQAFRRVTLAVACGAFDSPNYAAVTVHGAWAVARGFPVTAARFESSSPPLNAVRACVDATMRMCMQRLHLDSPVHQEGLGCTGDYRIEALIGYALYGEARLARADIIRTARLVEDKNGVIFHTSYSLLYLDMIREYILFSGDLAILDETRMAVRLILERFAGYTGPEGLVSQAPNYMFIDWIVDGERDYHHPPAGRGMGAMTAFYIHALEVALELAAWEGAEAPEWRSRADAARAAFRELLWRPERGLFADGIPGISRVAPGGFLPPEDGVEAFSVHTNALAVAFGLADEAGADALLERCVRDPELLQPQPYFMHYLFDAVHRRGAFERCGAELLRRWDAIVAEHPDGLKECWNCGDYSHAWGGTPAWQCLRGILGVEILEPGCRKLRVVPARAGVDCASGDFVTPQGTVTVSRRFGADGEVVTDVTAPPGVVIVRE